MIFVQSEGTAARRRFPIYLVDATDGITPETGEAAGQPQISKAGGAWANTTNTLSALGNGAYYVELTATELDTLGPIQVRYKSANTAEFNAPACVIAANLNDAVRLGLTALPNAAADAAGGLPISDAGGLDLDAKLAATNEVTAARMGALTDWIDGGRLDLLLDAVKTKTDFLPSATAGASGGLLISGNNSGTTTFGALTVTGHTTLSTGLTTLTGPIASAITGNISGNLSGSVGSVTGNVGGNVGGNVTGSVGSLATQAKADVQAEAEEALQTYHLDHLIHSADPGAVVANSSLLAKLVSKSGTPAFADFDNTTDSLQALRDRGDAAWITAAGFSTHSAADVWAVGTRLLTAGTNIVLAKGTGVTGFNDLDAAGIRSAVGLASATLDTQLGTIAAGAAAILDDTGTSGVVVAAASKTGYSLAAAGLDQIVIETGLNARQALSINAAALAGVLSGAASPEITIKAAGVPATTRLVAAVDADGNRSAVTLTPPA